MNTPIRLVAGLGNPGREYANTRHNAGFWFVDRLAAKLAASFTHESKFGGDVAKAGALRLVKPMTFMNLSGRAVAGLARFFTIAPAEILVVHDELDLLPGKTKMKFGGGHAGHNGLRDIQAHQCVMAFERMRIFTGNANPKLAAAVCKHLNVSLGRCAVGRFSDGEVMVELIETCAAATSSSCSPPARRPTTT